MSHTHSRTDDMAAPFLINNDSWSQQKCWTWNSLQQRHGFDPEFSSCLLGVLLWVLWFPPKTCKTCDPDQEEAGTKDDDDLRVTHAAKISCPNFFRQDHKLILCWFFLRLFCKLLNSTPKLISLFNKHRCNNVYKITNENNSLFRLKDLFKKVLIKSAILQNMNLPQEFWHGLDLYSTTIRDFINPILKWTLVSKSKHCYSSKVHSCSVWSMLFEDTCCTTSSNKVLKCSETKH